jgi:hypothetical protein
LRDSGRRGGLIVRRGLDDDGLCCGFEVASLKALTTITAMGFSDGASLIDAATDST